MAADAPKQAGHQMGRVFAHLVTNVVRDTRAAVAPAEAEIKRRSVNDMMDEWEVALGDRLGEAISDIDFGDNAPAIIDMMHELANEPKNSIDLFLQVLLFIPLAIAGAGTAANIAYGEMFNQLRARYHTEPLDPSLAAGLVATGKLAYGAGTSEALFSGINPDRFTSMVKAAQTALPTGSLLDLWRRQAISHADLVKGLTQNGVDGDWIAAATQLAYSPPAPGVWVDAAIKGVIGLHDAELGYEAAGGLGSTFDTVVKSAGSAIGIVEAGKLYTHHLISREDYEAVIRYSHVNPRFEAMAAMQQNHWLTPFQIHQLVNAGSITPEQAAKWLIEDGYQPEQVSALTQSAHVAKATTAKKATESLIVDTYEAGFTTQAHAVEQLGKLGYPVDEATIILQSYDAKRTLAAMNSAVSHIHSAFLARRITANTASADLDSIGVHFSVRDHLLADWEVERSTAFKTLSMAQIGSLARKAIITYQSAIQRWEAMGYSPDDAQLLALDYGMSPT